MFNSLNIETESQFVRAVCEGGLFKVRLLFSASNDNNLINKPCLSGDKPTPLLLACLKGHQAVAQYLVSEGASLRGCCQEGLSAAHWAAFGGHEDLFKWLLHKDASLLNQKNEKGWSVLHCAAFGGHGAFIETVVNDKGFRLVPTLKDACGWTILHAVAHHGHAELVKTFSEKYGLDPKKKDSNGWTLLHSTALIGNLPAVDRLIQDHGATVENLQEILQDDLISNEMRELLQSAVQFFTKLETWSSMDVEALENFSKEHKKMFLAWPLLGGKTSLHYALHHDEALQMVAFVLQGVTLSSLKDTFAQKIYENSILALARNRDEEGRSLIYENQSLLNKVLSGVQNRENPYQQKDREIVLSGLMEGKLEVGTSQIGLYNVFVKDLTEPNEPTDSKEAMQLEKTNQTIFLYAILMKDFDLAKTTAEKLGLSDNVYERILISAYMDEPFCDFTLIALRDLQTFETQNQRLESETEKLKKNKKRLKKSKKERDVLGARYESLTGTLAEVLQGVEKLSLSNCKNGDAEVPNKAFMPALMEKLKSCVIDNEKFKSDIEKKKSKKGSKKHKKT